MPRGLALLVAVLLATLPLAAALAQAPPPVPDEASDLNQIGLELWHLGRYGAAIDAFTQSINLATDWLPPYNHRALALAARGDYGDALVDASKAIELISTLALPDSERAAVLDTRAYALLLLERWDEALADYAEVLDATPDTRPAYPLGRGLALLQLGNVRQGIEDLKWGTLIAPGYRPDPQTDDLLERAHRALLDLMPDYRPDLYEPDDGPEQAKPLPLDGGSQVRSLHAAGDADWVSLDLDAGQLLVLFTNSPNCDTYLTLYAPDGRTILREDDDGGTYRDSVIETTIRTAGTYYASVRHFFANEGTCESYRLGGVARSAR